MSLAMIFVCITGLLAGMGCGLIRPRPYSDLDRLAEREQMRRQRR